MSHKYDNLRNEVEQLARERQITDVEFHMLLYRIHYIEELEQETIEIINGYDCDSHPETLREKFLNLAYGGR
ncbi:hypothetical protein I7X12_07835 [Halosimplex litoreum]|uniref:Uncharacterized protein n=1 Tax=Halosimplex litoreum TaxID=1198301 RepID=A0A7T3G1C3_9EURY|nr:hypothetical protein [Halosimplex litoreum]QPV64511.1 hypothetical protein I7X12_07835 [Halosimplex litoreum]